MGKDLKLVVPTEFKVNADERIIEGYTSVFNVRDFGGDVVVPGAYKKSIDERLSKNRIKVMRNHKTLIGRSLEAYEDEHGLYTKSQISETAAGDETLTLARDGVLDGMSVGVEVVQSKFGKFDNKTSRFLKELMLHEYSIVDFPMNDEARITSVKSMNDAAGLLAKISDVIEFLGEKDELTPEELELATDAAKQLDDTLYSIERATKQFEIQTLIFPKEKWDSQEEVVKWAKDHNFKANKVDETGSSYRLRQEDPDAFERMRTICISPNDVGPNDEKCLVKAVGGPMKEGAKKEDKGLEEIYMLTMALPSAITQLVSPDELSKEAMEVVSSAVTEFSQAADTLKTLLESVDATPGKDDSDIVEDVLDKEEKQQEPDDTTPVEESLTEPLANVGKIIEGFRSQLKH